MQTRLIFLITLLLIVTQAALAGPNPNNVTIQLRWQHQFQFAGYYAALHKGFYKDAGLDVTLKEGGPNISAIEEVIQGRADFGVSTSGLVKSYLEGKPVLMLAPIFQHSPQVLLSLDPLIKTPADVAKAGVIGLQPGDESLDLKAMFVNEGILLDKLTINTEGLGLKDLMSGKIVAMNAYLSNEPFFLQKRGLAYSVIDSRQYGMDFYSDVLFTSRMVGKDRPDVVASFRTATLKGWEYALAHQDEIIGLILSQYNTQAKSRDYLIFEAKTLANLIGSDVIQLGHSNPGRWRHIVETYAKFGIIKFNYSLDGFFYDPHPPPPDMTWLYRLLVTVLLAMSGIACIVFYIHRINRKLHTAHKVIETTLNEQHQFVDMLTHELKTPISVVTLTLDQMSAQNPQSTAKHRAERALDDMNKIVDSCQKLDQLERQKPAMKVQPCQIPDILALLKANCLTPERLAITVASMPDIDTDPQLLSFMLSNLLNNALMYSPPLSVITVRAMEMNDAGTAGIMFSIQNMPGAAGMPDPGKLFKKYYRSPGAQEQTGSGLGLYLVQSFAGLLGGKVRYEVQQEQIRLTLWLPC
jgi:ABC-type nitrate/sulfonate/bicarbonate transport system substrate-binding protein/nitrogen-specific signal transduction histidine kinase